jgi:hypothetical protein
VFLPSTIDAPPVCTAVAVDPVYPVRLGWWFIRRRGDSRPHQEEGLGDGDLQESDQGWWQRNCSHWQNVLFD